MSVGLNPSHTPSPCLSLCLSMSLSAHAVLVPRMVYTYIIHAPHAYLLVCLSVWDVSLHPRDDVNMAPLSCLLACHHTLIAHGVRGVKSSFTSRRLASWVYLSIYLSIQMWYVILIHKQSYLMWREREEIYCGVRPLRCCIPIYHVQSIAIKSHLPSLLIWFPGFELLVRNIVYIDR